MAIAPPTNYRGGYRYHFVTTPPDWLMCKLCHYPSREPNLTECCTNIFCKSCTEDVQRDSDTCPLCHSKGFVTNCHKQCEEVIRILRVICTNKDKGCPWEGTVSDITSHLDCCSFEEVTCPNDCGTSIQRQHLVSHVDNSCIRHTVECQYCHFTGEHQFIYGEHEVLCPKYLVPCPKRSQKTVKDSDSQRSVAEQESIGTQQTESMRVLEKYMGKETIQHFINIHTSAEKLSSGEEIIPVIVKMSDYTLNSRDKFNWYSDPFYTHRNGYKMCLFCHVGSTHLSVHLYLMRGPHDDQLTWPLKGYCRVKLLNQVSNSEHYVGTGNCDTDSHIRVTNGEQRSMWYSNKFINNKHLKMVTGTCQYLKDDSIFLQVYFKPLNIIAADIRN